MKESIIELLAKSKKALTADEMINKLHLTSDIEIEEFNNDLDELLRNYDVYKTTGDKFMDINNSPIKKGTYKINKDGNARIDVQKKSYFVRDNDDNTAVEGDIVLFETVSKGKGNEAKVLMVVDRNLNQVLGEVQNINDQAFLRTDNFKLNKLDIRLSDDSLVTGTKVIVKLRPTGNVNEYIGDLVRNIGYKDAPFVDIELVALKHGFDKDFSEEALNQVDRLPIHIQPEELAGRLDLRNLEIFTIDGKDTKDIDDAISLSVLPNGNHLVGVHIADVTHYMPEGSPLDKEAYLRSTSGYFANTVIPMLPQKMSNGICSLNPGVDRLTISFFAEVDKDGEIVDSFITPSIIHSRKQMNYDDVNEVLKGKDVPGYEQFANTLREMNKVSKKQIENRVRNGSLEMDSREVKIYCDENGKPDSFVVREATEGDNLIESFMLIANQIGPAKLEDIDAPCIYRIHERPELKKLESFIDLYRALGYYHDKPTDNDSKTVQAILEEVKQKEEAYILERILLRKFMKAQYSDKNLGHAGLAMPKYSQGTSPIRRYSDDVLHRLIIEYVCSGQKFEEEKEKWAEKLSPVLHNVKFFEGGYRKEPTYQRTLEWESMLPSMTYHISNRERQEIACEQEVTRMKSAEHMQERIGDLFNATVTGVNSKFLEVEIDENMVEGNIPLDSLPGHYSCNSEHFAAEDYGTRDAIRIGDKVEVQTVYANKGTQTVEFALSKVLSKVRGYEVPSEPPMTKQRRKELKRQKDKEKNRRK